MVSELEGAIQLPRFTKRLLANGDSLMTVLHALDRRYDVSAQGSPYCNRNQLRKSKGLKTQLKKVVTFVYDAITELLMENEDLPVEKRHFLSVGVFQMTLKRIATTIEKSRRFEPRRRESEAVSMGQVKE